MTGRRLYRSKTNKMVAGVCGGLGEHLGIDPVLIRLIFVVLAILHGSGILLYIVLWVALPAEDKIQQEESETIPESDSEIKEEKHARHHRVGDRMAAGLILIAIGLVLLFDRFLPFIEFSDYGPAIIILIGAFLVWNSYKGYRRHS